MYYIIWDMNCLNFAEYFSFSPGTRTRDDLTVLTSHQTYRNTWNENYFFRRVATKNNMDYDTQEALLECETKAQIKKILHELLYQFFPGQI